ncbi:MAG: (d)CMP kinase [Trueperaceae bacterium]
MSDVVTFDGPAASGKSTVARRIAERLGVPFVSSGLLYRAAAYLTLEEGGDPHGEEAVVGLLERHRVRLRPEADGNRVRVDGRDVTDLLHTDAVDGAVSAVASRPRVRAWVNDRLREIEGAFVIDGRDMGREVFPDAGCKLYLTARPEVRAARRVGERAADLESVTEAIRRRDELDARQSVPADDAVTLDTSDLDLDAVVDRAWRIVTDRLRASAS